jgi:glucose-6-phosphate 1-dehydrogenase
MQGDATLYARGDAVEQAWQFVQPIINAWELILKYPFTVILPEPGARKILIT